MGLSQQQDPPADRFFPVVDPNWQKIPCSSCNRAADRCPEIASVTALKDSGSGGQQ